MKKNILITREIMKEAHKLTRELKEEYKDIDYKVQLGLYISYLLEEEANNKDITIEDWIEDYYSNGLYSYILHKNNILQKNGYQSYDQKAEAKNTSAFYNILPSDIADIEQLALLKVVEKFDREGGTIQNKARFNIWSYACLNATKEYQRNLAKFKPNKRLENGSPDVGYTDNGELTILSNDDDISITRLDYERVLSDRQYEIVELLEQGYTKTEIAEIAGISRQAIHKHIPKIQDILIENGLAIGY